MILLSDPVVSKRQENRTRKMTAMKKRIQGVVVYGIDNGMSNSHVGVIEQARSLYEPSSVAPWLSVILD